MRVINSPGVEIQETDISTRVLTPAGTTVYVTGFSDQGPTDEVLAPSTLNEFESIYGLPTNAAERYFNHTVRAVFNSSGRVLVNRIPWGSGTGEGFGSKIGVLAYPVVALSANSTYTSSITSTNLNLPGQVTYLLGEPTQYNITKEEYLNILNGNTFTWSSSSSNSLGSLPTLSAAGLIVFNKSQTVIDSKYQGYYLGLADNTNINPASAYDAIKYVQTITTSPGAQGQTNYTNVPRVRLAFSLTATPAFGSNPANNSISQIMEDKITGYDTSTHDFDDTLNVGLFKLRQSVFLNDATTLDYVLDESYNVSIGASRQIFSEQGGAPINFFAENLINSNSNNLQVLVNPYISKAFSRVVLNADGTPTNKVRIWSQQLVDGLNSGNVTPSQAGGLSASFVAAGAWLGDKGDSLFPVGAYSESYTSDVETKNVGNLPAKLERSLERIKNDEVYDIDIMCEAGLGTIWAGVQNGFYFDDQQVAAGVTALRTSQVTLQDTTGRDAYMNIYNQFALLAGPPKDGGRGDMIFVADPIRQILVTGPNNKVINDPSKNFTVDIYWALRHQFELANTSYVTVAANWIRTFDNFSGTNVWVPPSGFIASLMASTDAQNGPWSAPAGYDRGLVRGAIDIAFSPNQRQRDDLYKINLNPIAQFQGQGITFFGQKTLSRKPSAFDRINVRRLFLYLEKATKATMKYFVFEPNTIFTRSRVVNTLSPLFERVKAADGIYDYLIICDERNNTPEVIDNNELIVDIYIKPTRTAEFITVNFIATRTDTNFEELIA